MSWGFARLSLKIRGHYQWKSGFAQNSYPLYTMRDIFNECSWRVMNFPFVFAWPICIMAFDLDKSKQENVKYFSYLSNSLAYDARWTREIKSRIAMAKAAFNSKKSFTSEFDSTLKKKLVKCYIWSTAFYDA